MHFYNKEQVRDVRINLNLSQREFANLLAGSHAQSISYWETGKSTPNRVKTALIAEVEKASKHPDYRAIIKAILRKRGSVYALAMTFFYAQTYDTKYESKPLEFHKNG